jgi:hypothetical protein
LVLSRCSRTGFLSVRVLTGKSTARRAARGSERRAGIAMRRFTFGMFAATLLAVPGCGNGGTFANKPRPATPVNLTVYINNARVSLSPDSVGAGEVVFIVTNQASKAESLIIHAAGETQALANAGPINPQSTDQVTVDFNRPGEYTVSTAGGGGSDAATAAKSGIQPAALHIGRKRPSSSDTLLQP